MNTLRRYKKHYKLQLKPGSNKVQLVEVGEFCSLMWECIDGASQYGLLLKSLTLVIQEAFIIQRVVNYDIPP